MEVMITIDGVSPATEGVGVTTMTEVWTTVDGACDGAVTIRVEAGGEVELAGGADDAGRWLEAGGVEDCGGAGVLEEGGAGEGDAGGAEDGGSAEDGLLEGDDGGEEGAGAADGVTERKGGDEAAVKEGSNVLAVLLLAMLSAIDGRRGCQSTIRLREHSKATTTTTTKKWGRAQSFKRVRRLVSRIAAGRKLGSDGSERMRRRSDDLRAKPPQDPRAMMYGSRLQQTTRSLNGEWRRRRRLCRLSGVGHGNRSTAPTSQRQR